VASKQLPDPEQQTYLTLLEGLELSDGQRLYMRGRCLDQLVWMERAARRSQRRFYALSMATIVGGVVVPGLVGINVVGGARVAILWTTFGISLVVGICAAILGFFRFGERWRHYRRTVEFMKSEVWRFSQLAGDYAAAESHSEAFPLFADRVERAFRDEAEVYVTEVAREEPRRPSGP
jgi:hypothetical protein